MARRTAKPTLPPGISVYRDGYRISVFVGRDATGKQIRHSETLPHASLAEAKARKSQMEVRHGLHVAPTTRRQRTMTVRDLVTWWIEGASLARSTRAEYSSAIRCHIDTDLIADERIGDVGPMALSRFNDRLTAKGLSPTRVNAVHNILSAAFRFAVRQEVLDRNPAPAATRPGARRRPHNGAHA